MMLTMLVMVLVDDDDVDDVVDDADVDDDDSRERWSLLGLLHRLFTLLLKGNIEG